MATTTPTNGFRSPSKASAAGRQRVTPAIPLHYPSHRRGGSKAVTQSQELGTPAKSEKSESGEDAVAIHGLKNGILQHPMTPESLSSSIHKAGIDQVEESLPVPETATAVVDVEHANGISNDSHAMPPLEPQSTLRLQQDETDTEVAAVRSNGNDHQLNGNVKTKPRSDSKPLRVLQAPPPEFHPSEPSSTPLSASSVDTAPYYPQQTNGTHSFAPHMPPRPFQAPAFNPEAVFQPNGPAESSRSPSHTSSSVDRPHTGADMHSPVTAFPAVHEMRAHTAAALQDHILKSFDRSGSSDLTIVFSNGNRSQRRTIKAHTLIVQRSTTLWGLVSQLEAPSQTVYVHAQPFMTETGFVAALRYLYGAPLWVPETLFGELGQLSADFMSGASPAHFMSEVLGYIASGYYLGIPDVVQAGLSCVRRLQTWDTVVLCLAFGLAGGLDNQFWSFVLSPESQDAAGYNEQSRLAPIYGQASNHILHDTLVWIAMAFPPVFQFASTATQLPDLPRLPTVVEHRPSQADPRLSLIQFGELAMEETGRPDYLTFFISSVLLSLPFATLSFLFEQPALRQKPQLDLRAIADAVVTERENRRTAVLSAKRLKGANDPALWDNTRWRERVVFHPTLQLQRERISEEADTTAGA